MRPMLVLFDVDGTLIDSAGAGRRAIERAFARIHAIEAVASRTSGVRFAGMTDPAIFRALARAVGVGEDGADREDGPLRRCYLEALREEMAAPDPRRRVMPGVRELLDALVAIRGVHLGLLTGNLEAGARIKLEPFGLNRYFPAGGFGSDHHDRREIARRARETLSRAAGVEFEPDRVWVVGDTEHDVDCARANGFRALAVESGWVPRSALEYAEPDALFADLSDRVAVLRAIGLDATEVPC